MKTELPTHRAALSVVALLVVSLLGASSARAVPSQSWNPAARIGAGAAALNTSPAATLPMAPDDTTGFLIADGAGASVPVLLDSAAIGTFGLSSGFVAGGGSWSGVNSGDPAALFLNANGNTIVFYGDDLSISSPSLANGTPVTLRFVYELAFDVDSFVNGSFNNSLHGGFAEADVSSSIDGNVVLSEPDNRLRIDSQFEGLDTQTGLFAGVPRAEFLVPTTVGATLAYSITIDGKVGSKLHPNPDGLAGPPGSGFGVSLLAVAFGAEAVGSDAVITSSLLGAPFPGAAGVDSAASQAALPMNPLPAPEPSTSTLAISALVTTALIRVRRRT